MANALGKVAGVASASIGKVVGVALASIGKVAGVVYETGAGPVVVDSYAESNTDGQDLPNATYPYVGQTFAVGGSSYTLDSCKFYLKRVGDALSGSRYAYIYSHTGTWGSSGVPNTLLATSDAFDASAIGTDFALHTFNFSGANRVTLDANTKYCVVIWSNAGTLYVGQDESAPSHAGNEFYATTTPSWTARAIFDNIFYVYGIEI